jgi:membrane protein YqaA with SNARE-associated domain
MRRSRNHMGTRKKRYTYIQSNANNRDRNIILKEHSLYKPLLYMFLIFMFVQILLFESIFDRNYGAIMDVLRQFLLLFSSSAIATLLILPVSVLDIQLLAIYSNTIDYSHLFVVVVTIFAVFSDTVFAYVGYRFTKTLRKIFANKTNKADVERNNAKLHKYGNFGMFIFACTPLPFTLAIYTAGAIRLRRSGFLLAVAAGRTVKYSAFALFLRLFGINLVQWGQTLFQVIFGS